MASLLVKNIIANFIGKIWTAILSLLFVPVYIHCLGIESYALIGFFSLLSLFIVPIDSAIGFTLNRELARWNAKQEQASEIPSLLRSFEILFWVFSFFIGIGIFFSADYLSHHWISSQHLSVSIMSQSISLMGIALILQFPISFYSQALQGLQKQVLMNLLLVIMSTLRSVGAVGILVWISPSILAFFIWQACISLIHVFLIAYFLWRCFPNFYIPFKYSYFAQLSPLALRMGLLAIFSLILMHGDKILVSKLTSLEHYGYYTLATNLAGSLYFIILPLFSAFFPKYCEKIIKEPRETVHYLYYHSCQLLAVLVIPAGCLLAFFSKEILFLWTHHSIITENTFPILIILSLGTVFNSLMNMPYALQLAKGWTRLTLIQNVISIIFLFPLTICLFHFYGLVGAAIAWFLHNLIIIFICIPIIHRKLLNSSPWKWFYECFFLPTAASSMMTFLGFSFRGMVLGFVPLIVFIGTTFLISFLATVLITPLPRRYVLKYVFQRNKNMLKDNSSRDGNVI